MFYYSDVLFVGKFLVAHQVLFVWRHPWKIGAPVDAEPPDGRRED